MIRVEANTQGHESLCKIIDFILKKRRSPKDLQKSDKDEGNAFGKQNELTKLMIQDSSKFKR